MDELVRRRETMLRRLEPLISEAAFPQAGVSIGLEDRPKEIVVSARLEGFDKEDVSVEVSGGMIVVAAQAGRERRHRGGLLRQAKSLRRAMSLPCPIDAAGARAKWAEGRLTIVLPKLRSSEARKIDVR